MPPNKQDINLPDFKPQSAAAFVFRIGLSVFAAIVMSYLGNLAGALFALMAAGLFIINYRTQEQLTDTLDVTKTAMTGWKNALSDVKRLGEIISQISPNTKETKQ